MDFFKYDLQFLQPRKAHCLTCLIIFGLQDFPCEESNELKRILEQKFFIR